MGQIARMFAQLGERLYQAPKTAITGVDAANWPSAGQPIQPLGPPGSEPLGMPFWYGQNMTYTPRPDANLSFPDLRAAATYPLARICIENVKDQLCQVKWKIQLKQQAGETRKEIKDRRRAAQKGDPVITKLTDFFERPNFDQVWPEFARNILDDMLVCDNASILFRKNLKGKLAEMRWVPGDTIARYIDDNGWTPRPPDPAYVQLYEGAPRVQLTTDQLMYKPRNIVARNTISSFLYGYSPVEQVFDEIKIGAARLAYVMRYYDKGSFPNFLHIVPPGVTPSKMLEAMNFVNSQLSGNLSERREYRTIQGFNREGKDQVIFPKEPVLADVFDELHIRKICFAFGTSPQRLQRMLNRGSSQSNQQSAEEEGLKPWMNWMKVCIMDPIIRRITGGGNYEAELTLTHDTDDLKESKINVAYVHEGILLRNEVREDLGYDPNDNPAADELSVTTPQGTVVVGKQIMVQRGDPAPKSKPNDAAKTITGDMII